MKKLTIMSIALVIIAATLELLDVGLQRGAIGQTQTPEPQTPQPQTPQPQIPQIPIHQPIPTPQSIPTPQQIPTPEPIPTPQQILTPQQIQTSPIQTPQPKPEDPKNLGYVSPEFAENFSQQQLDQINANVETLLLTQSCSRCDLRAVKLVNINLKNPILTGADLSDANLRNANIDGASIDRASMAGTTMPDGRKNQ